MTAMPRFAKMMTDVTSELHHVHTPPPRFATPRFETAPDMRTVDDLLERPAEGRRHAASISSTAQHQALHDVSLTMPQNCVTALIGPSGCGKSTFLRCLNRMNDMIEGTRLEGEILLDDDDIYRPRTDVVELRKRVGMVFQKSNPFPKSIYDNVAYGPRVAGVRKRAALDEIVEKSLRRSALWDEVSGPARTSRPCSFPAASSSGCASPARWRPTPTCC